MLKNIYVFTGNVSSTTAVTKQICSNVKQAINAIRFIEKMGTRLT